MRPLWLGLEVKAAGENRPPCQAQERSRHPLCLSWSLGCQEGAGMIRDPLGPGQPVRWDPSEAPRPPALQGLALGVA